MVSNSNRGCNCFFFFSVNDRWRRLWHHSACLPDCESQCVFLFPNAGQYVPPRWRSREQGVKVTDLSESEHGGSFWDCLRLIWCVGDFTSLGQRKKHRGKKKKRALFFFLRSAHEDQGSSTGPKLDVRTRKNHCSGKGEQRGLSSEHVELFSLTAMTITRSVQTRAVTAPQTCTYSHLSSLLWCCDALFFFLFLCSSLNPHYVLSFSSLPAPLKQRETQDRLTSEHQSVCWNRTAFMSATSQV